MIRILNNIPAIHILKKRLPKNIHALFSLKNIEISRQTEVTNIPIYSWTIEDR